MTKGDASYYSIIKIDGRVFEYGEKYPNENLPKWTNNRAECYCLIKILSDIGRLMNKQKHVITVHSDSMYVYWGLKKSGGNRTNKDIWHQIWSIIRKYNLKVKGIWNRRDSTQENKKCDAKAATFLNDVLLEYPTHYHKWSNHLSYA
jgi:ribonuclease HI